ncbi:MAG: VOC family protein [Candidatus Acidiferrum sp.]
MRRAGIGVGAVCALVVAVVFAAMATWAGETARRPKILGIFQVRISVSNLVAAREFYSGVTNQDLVCHWCETSPPPTTAVFRSGQLLQFVPGDPAAHSSRVTEVAFAVDDPKLLKQLLQANKIAFEETNSKVGPPSILLKDPEGNALRFVPSLIAVRPKVVGEEEKPSTRPDTSMPGRIIHAGWVVKDRAAMDKFYKDVLGFRVYWTGGMKDGETDWVDMQVPDGTDWIEFMLNVPENADKETLGVMNHIALGVTDVRATAKALHAKGMKLPEEPKIGRDGKWQLNLYDPDETRVELMEFTPVERPCCSEYTGNHPKP